MTDARTELAELMDYARASVEEIARKFEQPDDDFRAVVLSLRENSELDVIDVGAAFESERNKERFVNGTIPAIVLVSEPVVMAMVSSAWTSVRHRDDPLAGMRPSEDPDRIETVVVAGTTGDYAMLSSATILRDGVNAPTLGAWLNDDGSDGNQAIKGVFLDAMQNAMNDRAGAAASLLIRRFLYGEEFDLIEFSGDEQQ